MSIIIAAAVFNACCDIYRCMFRYDHVDACFRYDIHMSTQVPIYISMRVPICMCISMLVTAPSVAAVIDARSDIYR